MIRYDRCILSVTDNVRSADLFLRITEYVIQPLSFFAALLRPSASRHPPISSATVIPSSFSSAKQIGIFPAALKNQIITFPADIILTIKISHQPDSSFPVFWIFQCLLYTFPLINKWFFLIIPPSHMNGKEPVTASFRAVCRGYVSSSSSHNHPSYWSETAAPVRLVSY